MDVIKNRFPVLYKKPDFSILRIDKSLTNSPLRGENIISHVSVICQEENLKNFLKFFYPKIVNYLTMWLVKILTI